MTIASTTMDGMVEREAPASTRGLGIVAIATGIAGLVLLAGHPGGDAKIFADVIRNEAANQGMNALVHGGFIVVLAFQVICYAVFSRSLGHRVSALAGFVFFAMGAAFICASLVLDGLVTPAIAARYVAKPDKIENARLLFIIVGTTVGFLMPIGLTFQSAAIASWGWALRANGSRITGAIGFGLGGLLFVALAASFAMMNPFVPMAAMAATAVWAIIVGVLLTKART